MAGKKKAERLEVVHPDCAGIDVGKRKHYVAVDPSRFEEPVRHFGAFTRDLEAMAEWLSGCGVRQVAMESTGCTGSRCSSCWSGAGLEVHLVNPRATKQVSGRKSDVLELPLDSATDELWVVARCVPDAGRVVSDGRQHRPQQQDLHRCGAPSTLATHGSRPSGQGHRPSTARLIYAMLTRGEEYVERDLATMETERRDRQIKNLQR